MSLLFSSEQAHVALQVELGERSYPIWLGPLLQPAVMATEQTAMPPFLDGLPPARCAVIVSNTTVMPLYGQALEVLLRQRYAQVLSVVLSDGEAYKTWDSIQQIMDALLNHACDRKTVLFALGGGVVGDLTGFAAAIYMRGVPFVQIPTTLLAQVDSSVGGKTAINHPLGKNMIGAFYQPCAVWCDSATLKTLPARELAAGLAEVIKYGPIADMTFFAWLETHLDDLLAQDPHALAYAIQKSCEIKAKVVSLDEREAGLRAILNFGHTFGHAIEAGLGFGVWLHGEAVGCGMVMAARLSTQLGHLSAAVVDRIERLIARAGLPTRGPATLTPADYWRHMQVDKKAEGGQIQFVLIDAPEGGHAATYAVPQETVMKLVLTCTDHDQ